jgi:hypothetical protein
MRIWNRDFVNVMGPTFELDYTEKYHALLLASRIISDALTAPSCWLGLGGGITPR